MSDNQVTVTEELPDRGPWREIGRRCGLSDSTTARAIWKRKLLPYETVLSVPRTTYIRESDLRRLLAAKRVPGVIHHPALAGPLAAEPYAEPVEAA